DTSRSAVPNNGFGVWFTFPQFSQNPPPQPRPAAKPPPPQPPLRQLREEPLHLVQPRRAGRREMHHVARVPLPPPFDPRRLVRAVVVHDQVNRHPRLGGNGRVQALTKPMQPRVPPRATGGSRSHSRPVSSRHPG